MPFENIVILAPEGLNRPVKAGVDAGIETVVIVFFIEKISLVGQEGIQVRIPRAFQGLFRHGPHDRQYNLRGKNGRFGGTFGRGW